MKIFNLLASGLVLAVAACWPVGFEAEVFDRKPFTAPPLHEAWWSATEACSRLSGTLSAITWHLASGITGDGVVARGRWSPPHEIIIVRGYEDEEPTVRHEMLHDLLSGDSDHTSGAWSRSHRPVGTFCMAGLTKPSADAPDSTLPPMACA